MTSHELGYGVSIEPSCDHGWKVRSRRMVLPWTPRVGIHPGSAVLWQGKMYEVVADEESESGGGWILQPWSDSEVMHTVFCLERTWLEKLAVADEQRRRGALLRLLSIPAAPMLALAPASFQRRWRNSWGFPAGAATAVSAILELGAGGVGLVQLAALGFGADGFLSGPFRLLAVIGPVLSAEAVARLSTSATQGEPMGSILGLPLLLLDRNPGRGNIADRVRPPRIVRTTIATAVMCMAPRTYQERWARHLGVRAVWFTLLGAAAELFGGWVNLGHGSTRDFSSLAVNLVFILEAVVRLALLISTGRPVGSLLGWVVQPLLARLMPGESDSGFGE